MRHNSSPSRRQQPADTSKQLRSGDGKMLFIILAFLVGANLLLFMFQISHVMRADSTTAQTFHSFKHDTEQQQQQAVVKEAERTTDALLSDVSGVNVMETMMPLDHHPIFGRHRPKVPINAAATADAAVVKPHHDSIGSDPHHTTAAAANKVLPMDEMHQSSQHSSTSSSSISSSVTATSGITTSSDSSSSGSIKMPSFPVFKPPSDYSGNIFLDWIGDSDDFGYLNYKSLESLLIQYPQATFTVSMLANGNAQNYKIGNLLSTHYFQKYLKMGYQVHISLDTPRSARFYNSGGSSSSSSSSHELPPGFVYWRAELEKCCADFKGDFSRRIFVPLHAFFYRRILSLYNHGGIYSDFSWYHRQPLDMFSSPQQQQQQLQQLQRHREFNGIVLKDVCRPKKPHPLHEVSSYLYLRQPRDSLPVECYTSTLMAFNKGNKVLRCMLEQYEDSSNDFRQCITHADAVAVGNASFTEFTPISQCMQHAFHECFVRHNAKNDLLYSSSSSSSDSNSNSGSTRDAESINGDGDHLTEQIKSVIRTAAEAGAHDNRFQRSMQLYQQHASAITTAATTVAAAALKYDRVAAAGEVVGSALDCSAWWAMLRDSFDSSSKKKHSAKQLKHAVNMAEICSIASDNITRSSGSSSYHEQWHQRKVHFRGKIATAEELSLMESVVHSDVLWLGATAAYSNEWLLPAAGSLFDHILSQHRLPMDSIVHRADVLHYNISETRRLRLHNRVMASEWLTAEEAAAVRASASSQEPLPLSLQERAYEVNDKDSGGSRSGSSSSSGRSKLLAVTQPPCHHYHVPADASEALKRQASTSCAPHFMVPGFMKAGSTALFASIMLHPQMVHNLRGVVFKETGCYFATPDRARRMQCFPHVEEHEHLYFGDGTVWYANLYQLAHFIARDNPNIRVIFTVRNRVKRTESHHRFTYFKLEKLGVGNLNVAIERALNRSEGQLMELYDLAVDAAKEEKHSQQRAKKLEAVVDKFFSNVRAYDSKNVAWNQLKYVITNSLYLPSIYKWCQLLPRNQIAVIRAEDYSASKVRVSEKMAYLSKVLDMPHEFENFKAAYESDMVIANATAIATASASADSSAHDRKIALVRAEKLLNSRYMVERMNDIYRFLGVSPVDSVPSFSAHATGDVGMRADFKLNAAAKQQLTDFYRPFDQLLEEFLSDFMDFKGYYTHSSQHNNSSAH